MFLYLTSFLEYYEDLIESLREKTGSDECVYDLKETMESLDMMLKMNPGLIEKEFKLVLKRLKLIASVACDFHKSKNECSNGSILTPLMETSSLVS